VRSTEEEDARGMRGLCESIQEGIMRIGAFGWKPLAALAGSLLLYNCGQSHPDGLELTKSGPDFARAGDVVTYTIQIQINGGGGAEDVVVTDPTPAGLEFLANSGHCDHAFPCDLGDMEPDQTVQIESRYMVPLDYDGPDTIENTAEVTGTMEFDDPDDNSDTVETEFLSGEPPSTTTTTTSSSSTSSSSTSSTTTSSSSTTTTTSGAGCLASNALHNKVFTEIYDCRQTFTGGMPFCAEEDEEDDVKFTHTGSGNYQVRDEPDTGFLYSGTLSCLTFNWTAVSPNGYTESGTWTFDSAGTSFSGPSSYAATNGSYAGNCSINGALVPNVPPAPSLSPCN
jgi:uncharacterized repeat protein (TIGR01451 family)